MHRQLRTAKLGGMSDQFEGSCLCGAVRFVASGQPESVVWCHCESCRKHSGAPVSVFVAFKRDAYVVTDGQITKFNSSPGRWRGFCARCGSTLTCEGERSNETHFPMPTAQFARYARPYRRAALKFSACMAARKAIRNPKTQQEKISTIASVGPKHPSQKRPRPSATCARITHSSI